MKPANMNNKEQLEASVSPDLPEPSIHSTIAPAATQAPNSRAASPDILALIERNRIESLKRKQRSDSFLNKLTRDQLTKVLEWFDAELDIALVHHQKILGAPN